MDQVRHAKTWVLKSEAWTPLTPCAGTSKAQFIWPTLGEIIGPSKLPFLPADYKNTLDSYLRARPICYLKLAEEVLPIMTAKKESKFKLNQKGMTERHFYLFQRRKKQFLYSKWGKNSHLKRVIQLNVMQDIYLKQVRWECSLYSKQWISLNCLDSEPRSVLQCRNEPRNHLEISTT